MRGWGSIVPVERWQFCFRSPQFLCEITDGLIAGRIRFGPDQDLPRLNVKFMGNLTKRSKGQVVLAPFYPPIKGAIQSGPAGKRLLRNPLELSQAPYHQPHQLEKLVIHSAMLASMS